MAFATSSPCSGRKNKGGKSSRRRPSSPRFEDDLGQRKFGPRPAKDIGKFCLDLAAAALFVGYCAVGGLENPEWMAVIGDLHRSAGAGHALDLQRLTNQRAKRDRFHAVRH